MYGLLHYRGDVTHLALPGRVLGQSGFQIPYEVTEAEYDAGTDRTTVHLQHASADTMRQLTALHEQVTQRVVSGGTPQHITRRQRRGQR